MYAARPSDVLDAWPEDVVFTLSHHSAAGGGAARFESTNGSSDFIIGLPPLWQSLHDEPLPVPLWFVTPADIFTVAAGHDQMAAMRALLRSSAVYEASLGQVLQVRSVFESSPTIDWRHENVSAAAAAADAAARMGDIVAASAKRPRVRPWGDWDDAVVTQVDPARTLSSFNYTVVLSADVPPWDLSSALEFVNDTLPRAFPTDREAATDLAWLKRLKSHALTTLIRADSAAAAAENGTLWPLGATQLRHVLSAADAVVQDAIATRYPMAYHSDEKLLRGKGMQLRHRFRIGFVSDEVSEAIEDSVAGAYDFEPWAVFQSQLVVTPSDLLDFESWSHKYKGHWTTKASKRAKKKKKKETEKKEQQDAAAVAAAEGGGRGEEEEEEAIAGAGDKGADEDAEAEVGQDEDGAVKQKQKQDQDEALAEKILDLLEAQKGRADDWDTPRRNISKRTLASLPPAVHHAMRIFCSASPTWWRDVLHGDGDGTDEVDTWQDGAEENWQFECSRAHAAPRVRRLLQRAQFVMLGTNVVVVLQHLLVLFLSYVWVLVSHVVPTAFVLVNVLRHAETPMVATGTLFKLGVVLLEPVAVMNHVLWMFRDTTLGPRLESGLLALLRMACGGGDWGNACAAPLARAFAVHAGTDPSLAHAHLNDATCDAGGGGGEGGWIASQVTGMLGLGSARGWGWLGLPDAASVSWLRSTTMFVLGGETRGGQHFGFYDALSLEAQKIQHAWLVLSLCYVVYRWRGRKARLDAERVRETRAKARAKREAAQAEVQERRRRRRREREEEERRRRQREEKAAASTSASAPEEDMEVNAEAEAAGDDDGRLLNLVAEEGEEEEEEDDDEEEEEETPLCRICFTGPEEGRLISPCLCSGSMRFVHVECLNDWRRRSNNPRSFLECDSCHYKYAFRSRGLLGSLLRSALVLHFVTIFVFAGVITNAGFVARLLLYATGYDIGVWVPSAELVDDWLVFLTLFTPIDVADRTWSYLSAQAAIRADAGGGAANHLPAGNIFAGFADAFLVLGIDRMHFARGLALVGGLGLLGLGWPALFFGGGGRQRNPAIVGGGGGAGLLFLAVGLVRTLNHIYNSVSKFSAQWLTFAEAKILDVGHGGIEYCPIVPMEKVKKKRKKKRQSASASQMTNTDTGEAMKKDDSAGKENKNHAAVVTSATSTPPAVGRLANFKSHQQKVEESLREEKALKEQIRAQEAEVARLRAEIDAEAARLASRDQAITSGPASSSHH